MVSDVGSVEVRRADGCVRAVTEPRRRGWRSRLAALVVLGLAAGCSATTAPPDGSATPPIPPPPLPRPAARLFHPDVVANGQVDGGQRSATARTSQRGSGPDSAVSAGRQPVVDDQDARPAEAFSPDGPVGGYARLILRPDLGATIRLEVIAEREALPSPGTLNAVRETLADATGKRVTVTEPMNIAGDGPGGTDWTADRIRQLAPGPSSVGGPVTIRLAFLAGRFADDERALGVAVNATTAAVFTERAHDAAGLLGDPTQIELAVAVHEIGHLLGLVDLVIDSDREDPEHPGHSPNRDSVMYWAVERDLVGTLLGAKPSTTFDDADRAELAAIRRSSNPKP